MIKTRLTSQNGVSGDYKSALDAVWKICCNEGPSSFYSGLTPALLGVSHLAIQFPLYEQLKRYLTGTGLGSWNEGEDRPQIPGILIASSLSKMCAGAATYPSEVIRTRLQTQKRMVDTDSRLNLYHNQLQRDTPRDRDGLRKAVPVRYRGIVNTTKTFLREEGWRALYAGIGTSMVRAIPASATTMLVYEIVVQALKRSKAEDERKLALRDTSERSGYS